jgi:hydrogenase nickel incorporation protein HypA/HybF
LHELALAEGIILNILDFAHKSGRHIVGFRVAIGEFAQFNKKLVEELLIELVKGTELEKANITVEVERAVIKCLYCGSELEFHRLIKKLPNDQKEMIHFLPELLNSFSKCPDCGKSDFEIEKGRSVRLVEVELDV